MHPQSLLKVCHNFNIKSTFTINLHDFTDTAPQPIASSDEPDFKPRRTKRKTPLYRMKMLLDLKKVKEEEREAIPHIPSVKEWRKQEKKREREEAKKAVKREKQLKKDHKLKAGVYIVH